MRLLASILPFLLLGSVVPSGKALLQQLQPRDSILIADQLEYGFELDGVAPGTRFGMPDLSGLSSDTLTVVRGWRIDTLKTAGRKKKDGLMKLRTTIVVAPFEEGIYDLPELPVLRMSPDGQLDTLLFEAASIDVKTMPVDTATFVIHDIKPQMRFPLTLQEASPWVFGALLLADIAVLIVIGVRRRRRRDGGAEQPQEEPYITALRALDSFRGDKFWAPERQKAYYSGITDTLKRYIDDTFGVDAPEMTTAELLAALRREGSVEPELLAGLGELLECADFVKFAKHIASDDENAKALPLAVRFVMETYRKELEEGQKSGDVL